MNPEILPNVSDEVIYANIERNSLRKLDWLEMVPPHEGIALMVGGGPSLAQDVEEIRQRQRDGQVIFALNQVPAYLARFDLLADYQIILDARPENAEFIHPVKERALLASQCDAAVFERATNPMLWHPVVEQLGEHLMQLRPYAAIGGGTTVGLSAICLVYALGYRKMHLYGYDSSHRDLAGHAYVQRLNDTDQIVRACVNGQCFQSSLTMAKQAEFFPDLANRLMDLGVEIMVHGEGLLPAVAAAMNVPLEERERGKYARMWENPDYGNFSPGLQIAPFARQFMQPGQTLLDLGCGAGKAGQWLSDHGLDVTLMDHVGAQVESDLPFIEGCIWEFMPNVDWIFCADVMEHLPPEKVDTVMELMASHARQVFLQIHCAEDHFGETIGERLHLTVEKPDWWRSRLCSFFEPVFTQDNGDSFLFVGNRK